MNSAADHRRAAGLVPWYAAGTLTGDERLFVERHLEHCGTCRELLETARRNADLASEGLPEDLLMHVDPLLLVEYANDPEGLEPWVREFVEERIAACEACRDALDRLRELPPIETPREETAGAGHRLRRMLERFAGAALRPRLAAVYLALLIIGVPAVLVLRGAGGAGAGQAVLAPGGVLRIEPEAVLRDVTGSRREPVRLAPGSGPVLVELMTDLRSEDREDIDGVRVELSCGGATVYAARRATGALAERAGRLAVPLVVEPARLPAGTTCELRVRAVASGRLVDGTVIARRSLVVARSAP